MLFGLNRIKTQFKQQGFLTFYFWKQICKGTFSSLFCSKYFVQSVVQSSKDNQIQQWQHFHSEIILSREISVFILFGLNSIKTKFTKLQQ